MGSQPNKEELAYIAGFLDGDGSLMLQVKNRKDSKLGWRLMFTICFYQDTRHSEPLTWIRRKLGIGYLSHRNDGMTELRINGYKQIEDILGKLLPNIRFKKVQAKMMLKAARILCSTNINKLEKKELMVLAEVIESIRTENYQSGKKLLADNAYKRFGLTPYRLNSKE